MKKPPARARKLFTLRGNPDNGTHTRVFKYSGGKDGAEAVLYAVENRGHAWPGGTQYLPGFIIGKTSRDFDATETIWAFFKKHAASK